MAFNPETAKANIHRFGVLLCLDVPLGVEFGIDYHFWEVGEKFKGVKLIPPGIHFVFYSYVFMIFGIIVMKLIWVSRVKNKYGGDASPRTSFFIYIKEHDILVRKWNPEEEQFYPVDEMDEDEMSRFAHGVQRMDFDENLGAYPMESLDKWHYLSNYITEEHMKRFQPVGAIIDSSSKPLTEKEKELIYKDTTPIMHSEKIRKPFYTHIPKRIQCSDPTLVVKYNFDKSYILNKTIQEKHGNDTSVLLGELQFCFIGFLLGQSFESFDQWKAILTLLLNCDEALNERKDFFVIVVEILHYQLEEITESFFEDVIAQNNFLHHLLRGFFEMALTEDIDESLRSKVHDLKKFVENRFGLNFEETDVDDEYTPVYVP